MKSVLIVLISCLIVISQQFGQKPGPQSIPNDWEWESEPVPYPERQCSCLPDVEPQKIAFTSIADMDVTVSKSLACDSSSKLKKIASVDTHPSHVTCNGVIVHKGDTYYEAVIGGGYGSKKDIKLNLTNYTVIVNYNKGNMDFQECGVIVDGQCSGDIFTGIAIFQANDPIGCCKNGNPGLTSVRRLIDITGKCSSRCSGTSNVTFAEPITNKGVLKRSIATESHELII